MWVPENLPYVVKPNIKNYDEIMLDTIYTKF